MPKPPLRYSDCARKLPVKQVADFDRCGIRGCVQNGGLTRNLDIKLNGQVLLRSSWIGLACAASRADL